MEKATVLIMLSLFTLLAGMAVAGHQLWDAERKKRSNGGPPPKGPGPG